MKPWITIITRLNHGSIKPWLMMIIKKHGFNITMVNHDDSIAMIIYTTFTNFSMKYSMMCKVYTDVGGIN